MRYKDSYLKMYLKDNECCGNYLNFDGDKFPENNSFNTNFNVDFLAEWFKDLYLNNLDNKRLFAKKSEWDKVVFDYYEIFAFKSYFKKHFKTVNQFRKTKDILSDHFTFRSKDIKGKLHKFYFCVSKKDFEREGVEYLGALQDFFEDAILSKV